MYDLELLMQHSVFYIYLLSTIWVFLCPNDFFGCRLTIKKNNMLKVLFQQHICVGKVPLRKGNFYVGV